MGWGVVGKKGQREYGTCAYCGTHGPITRDHVVARALFTRPLPAYMQTVPACDACNNTKSRGEGYLRDMLVLDLNGAQHPVARQLWSEKAARSVARPQSRLGRAIVEHGRLVDAVTPSGLQLVDQGMAIPVDEATLERVIAMIVRGLYYHERGGERLPDDYVVEVRRVPPGRVSEFWQDFERAGLTGSQRHGEGVFFAQYGFLDGDPGISMWMLLFYEAALFIAITDSLERRIRAQLAAASPRGDRGLVRPLPPLLRSTGWP